MNCICCVWIECMSSYVHLISFSNRNLWWMSRESVFFQLFYVRFVCGFSISEPCYRCIVCEIEIRSENDLDFHFNVMLQKVCISFSDTIYVWSGPPWKRLLGTLACAYFEKNCQSPVQNFWGQPKSNGTNGVHTIKLDF